ncbi:MAG TPA: 1-(5-phosphoribosyl)-5-[(5-phosphoribosylamino)methylideneamino] imidazole-4-carboxamide isomerase [Candidatus Limnocylindrales bacterium]|nr:1-(5-phosphoribosyl)-5-[(5-phosphoribosylamino)methylideneamino] imidazole-4-carboxamide isomerase [Candidatus Limnocylindrales bacterium]
MAAGDASTEGTAGIGSFELYPAIDIRGGRVVRLQQGDFSREQVHGDDVVEVARRFRAVGARWLHVVDLDGARSGERVVSANLLRDLVTAMREPGGAPTRIQTGGGLRADEQIAAVLDAGAARVVLGTAALRDTSFAGRAVDRFGAERIAVALDVRDGVAVGEGWVTGAQGVPVPRLVADLEAAGVATLVVTGISRDGVLAGPDVALLESVVATSAQVIASGGIASLGDLDAIRAIGCAGAIVGRALYEGAIDLAEAIEHVNRGLPTGG